MYEEIYGKHIDNVGVLRLDKKHGSIAKLRFINEIPSGDIDYYYEVFRSIFWNRRI